MNEFESTFPLDDISQLSDDIPYNLAGFEFEIIVDVFHFLLPACIIYIHIYGTKYIISLTKMDPVRLSYCYRQAWYISTTIGELHCWPQLSYIQCLKHQFDFLRLIHFILCCGILSICPYLTKIFVYIGMICKFLYFISTISVPTTDIAECSLVHFGQKRLVSRLIWNNNGLEAHSYEWQYNFPGLFQIFMKSSTLIYPIQLETHFAIYSYLYVSL